MKLKDHPGFKRLGILIGLTAFCISYAVFYMNEKYLDKEDVFVAFPVQAAIVAAFVFFNVIILYWVISGFRGETASEERSSYLLGRVKLDAARHRSCIRRSI